MDRQIHKLSSLAQGAFSGFSPIVFAEPHYSVANVMVHSVILDYRFRPVLLASLSHKDASEEEPVVSVVELAQASNSVISAAKFKFHPKDLAQFLFCDKEGRMNKKLTAREADAVYEEYAAVLQRMHEGLKTRFVAICPRAANILGERGGLFTAKTIV